MRTTTFGKLLLLLSFGCGIVLAEVLPQFPEGSVWRQDISMASEHPDSTAMLSTLELLGGFGGNRLQIDFTIRVVRADEDAPKLKLATLLDDDNDPAYY